MTESKNLDYQEIKKKFEKKNFAKVEFAIVEPIIEELFENDFSFAGIYRYLSGNELIKMQYTTFRGYIRRWKEKRLKKKNSRLWIQRK